MPGAELGTLLKERVLLAGVDEPKALDAAAMVETVSVAVALGSPESV